jgi:hypothetical protein
MGVVEMIDLTVNEETLKRAVERARQRNIVLPTFREQKDPDLIPEMIKQELERLSFGTSIPTTSTGSLGKMNRWKRAGVLGM